MKVAVVTFPGSNCDYDLYKAAQQVGAEPTFVWHRDHGLDGFDAVLLPGGFSYGDYLRPGAIARMSPIMEDVVAFVNRGGPVLGICNGFQVLCEAGLLPGALVTAKANSLQRQLASKTHGPQEQTAHRFAAFFPAGPLRVERTRRRLAS